MENTEAIGALIVPVVSAVRGVAALAGSRGEGWGQKMGAKKPGRGVKVTPEEGGLSIDIHIIVSFGCRIPEVAHQIQLETKKAVEEMAGQQVRRVNVTVEGVDFDSGEKGRAGAGKGPDRSGADAAEGMGG